ncbi:MAG: hypothetical protein V1725_05535 [archaeon]
MDANGTIERQPNGTTLVTVLGETWSKDVPGVTCLNPSDPEPNRVYQKAFSQKQIYLPSEYDKAISEHIAHPDNFVLSMNGYSRLSKDQLNKWGIDQEGAYEEACRALLSHAIKHLKTKFTGAQLKLIHGASDMGIDKSIQQVADEYNITPLGFSCPRFMLYVNDDNIPVYCAESSDDYADKYIKTLDLLIATGGREQAFKHDVLAAVLYQKRIHFVDVLNHLSKTAAVPAVSIDANGNRRVENAAAAMGSYVSFFNLNDSMRQRVEGEDIWDTMFRNIEGVTTEVCRKKMSPARKFT